MESPAHLPVYLPPNTLAIYGHGSIYGVSTNAKGYLFGQVKQMYFGAQNNIENKSVLFNSYKALAIKYSGTPYFLIQEEDIILTEKDL